MSGTRKGRNQCSRGSVRRKGLKEPGFPFSALSNLVKFILYEIRYVCIISPLRSSVKRQNLPSAAHPLSARSVKLRSGPDKKNQTGKISADVPSANISFLFFLSVCSSGPFFCFFSAFSGFCVRSLLCMPFCDFACLFTIYGTCLGMYGQLPSFPFRMALKQRGCRF